MIAGHTGHGTTEYIQVSVSLRFLCASTYHILNELYLESGYQIDGLSMRAAYHD